MFSSSQQSAPSPNHSTPANASLAAWPPSSALSSEQLLRGQKQVSIAHNGNLYKLQATKLGKLILTK